MTTELPGAPEAPAFNQPPENQPETQPEKLPDDHPVVKALNKANKEAADLRKKFADIEDRDKTEAQKLAERAETAAANLTKAEKAALRFEVALDKSLPKSLAVRLQGDTREEMEADADELLATLGEKRPAPSFDGGAREPAPNGDGDMNALIRQRLSG